MAQAPVRIFFLAGAARCGSTLAGRMLGQLPGLVNVGELGTSLLFTDAQAIRAPCGCGQEEAACPFWTAVAAGRPLRAWGEAWRTRRLLRLWRQMRRDAGLRARMAEALVPLYRRVAAQTGAEWVVDTSKNPAIGLILRELPGVELAMLHLIRDPRGTVASWRTRKGYLPKIRPIKVIGWIWAASVVSELLARRTRLRWRVRYRDFAADPLPLLEAAARELSGKEPGSARREFDFLRPGEVRLNAQHVLVSNPDKMTEGWALLRPAPVQLDRPSRWLTNVLTWPLLLRYGYFGLRGGEYGAEQAHLRKASL